jgi:hypothetical protein
MTSEEKWATALLIAVIVLAIAAIVVEVVIK